MQKLVTIETDKKEKLDLFTIRVTQEYSPEFDMGHWKYYITNKNGDVIKVQSSCCAPPDGKIDKKFLKEQLDRFVKEYKHHQSVLAKESK